MINCGVFEVSKKDTIQLISKEIEEVYKEFSEYKKFLLEEIGADIEVINYLLLNGTPFVKYDGNWTLLCSFDNLSFEDIHFIHNSIRNFKDTKRYDFQEQLVYNLNNLTNEEILGGKWLDL